MLNEEYQRGPMSILGILVKRKSDGEPGYDAPLPTLDQIRGFKRRFLPIEVDKEFEKVKELLLKLSDLDIENLGDSQGFSYGVKMGSGADNDPFVNMEHTN